MQTPWKVSETALQIARQILWFPHQLHQAQRQRSILNGLSLSPREKKLVGGEIRERYS